MSVVTTTTPIQVEVVTQEETRLALTCDGCGKTFDVVQWYADKTPQLPRAWWAMQPADGRDLFGMRRVRHACSIKCLLTAWTEMMAEAEETLKLDPSQAWLR